MADLWDYESRLQTTTSTLSGSYDQIIALSQGVINENFQKLYDMYKDKLNRCYFENPDIGKIDATIDAPKILIPGADKRVANLNEVLFQLKFLSGKLYDDKNRAIISDLAGWTFSVWAPIVPEKLTEPTSAAAKKLWAEKVAKIKQNFDHPGDYSIERLYAKISGSNWSKPDDETSFAVDSDTQERMSLSEWRELNEDVADRLDFWLGKWARKHENDGLNSIGVSFKEFDQKPTQERFIPTSLTHQTHQYQSKKNGFAEGNTGFGGAGDCNCLMYLEMVDSHTRPTETRLNWTGNFATLPRTPNEKGISGTYLLKREIFMDQILLSEFRALNRASDIVHEPLSFFIGSDASSYVNIKYGVGFDKEHPMDSDGAYDFKPVYDDKQVTGYTWTKTNKQNKDGPRIEQQVSSKTNCWGKAWVEDVMETTVTWATGGNTVKLAGKAVSHENCRWSVRGTKDFDNSQSYFHDVYTVTWSITLKIVTGEVREKDCDCGMSILDVEIDDGPGNKGNIDVSVVKNQKGVKMNSHDKNLEKYLRERMEEQMPRIIKNIREKLKTSGRFIYPGNGRLIFENPVIGLNGSLNAQLRYQELQIHEWIRVPGEPDVTGEMPVKDKTTEVETRPAGSNLALDWSSTKIAPSTKSSVLKLTALNKGTQTVKLMDIAISFNSGGTNASSVFKTENFKIATKLAAEGDVNLAWSKPVSYDATVRSTVRGKDYTQWTINIEGTDDKPLEIAAGARLEVSIMGESTAAATYGFRVVETAEDDKTIIETLDVVVAK